MEFHNNEVFLTGELSGVLCARMVDLVHQATVKRCESTPAYTYRPLVRSRHAFDLLGVQREERLSTQPRRLGALRFPCSLESTVGSARFRCVP
jgi:hypothetical protein